MKIKILIVLMSLISFVINAQGEENKRKVKSPIWLSHDDNVDIIGLSFGFYPEERFTLDSITKTFGVRLEPFPLAFIYVFVAGGGANNESDYTKVLKSKPLHKIYGLNITTGSYDSKDVCGISLAGISQYSRVSNGVSVSGLVNEIHKANGLVVAFGGNAISRCNGVMVATAYGNYSKQFNGLQIAMSNDILEKGCGVQIGLYNNATNFKGVQLGIWNKNDERTLPIINWNFKS